MSAADDGAREALGQPPSDRDLLAYLEGAHGPPSAEAVEIIQDWLVRAATQARP